MVLVFNQISRKYGVHQGFLYPRLNSYVLSNIKQKSMPILGYSPKKGMEAVSLFLRSSSQSAPCTETGIAQPTKLFHVNCPREKKYYPKDNEFLFSSLKKKCTYYW